MKKIIIALLLLGAVCSAQNLSYTVPEADALLVRVDKMGWAYYTDSVYTNQASGLNINNESKRLECNGLGSTTETNYLPAGVSALWDSTATNIVSGAVGNAFQIRVSFTVDPVQTTGIHFDVDFDIGTEGSPIIISSRTVTAPKSGDPFDVSIGIPLFSMATFVENGCAIYIDSTQDSAEIDIYDIGILIVQDYYGSL